MFKVHEKWGERVGWLVSLSVHGKLTIDIERAVGGGGGLTE